MARQNDSIVYAESKLAICRKLGSSEWEVRGPNGFAVTTQPTDRGGHRTVLVRADGENAVLETTPNGAKARIAAVRHAAALGLITEDAKIARLLFLVPAKKA